MIVYISIGNSDDKLSQQEWSACCSDIVRNIVDYGQPHGQWYSLPDSPYQNACWCVEFKTPEQANAAKYEAILIRKNYHQDSIAWAIAETDFI